jgi:undecaprenyl-diphosphatase
MSIIEALVLGVVQGLTEFLPISSTAHLRAVPALLGWEDPGAAYSAVIQLGSVLAVLSYFLKDMLTIAAGSLEAIKTKDYGNHHLRLAIGIVLGTIPICVIGLLIKTLLEQDNSPLRSLYVIGGASIFMGLFLLFAEKVGKRNRNLETISIKDGILVGLGQCMALIPGCSRSGSTLTVALLLNLTREEAARFSFLLGIPAITLAGLLELKELVQHGLSGDGLSALIAGLISSTIVSYLAIAWLLRYLQKHSTTIFIVYRLIFGASLIWLSYSHLIK